MNTTIVITNNNLDVGMIDTVPVQNRPRVGVEAGQKG